MKRSIFSFCRSGNWGSVRVRFKPGPWLRSWVSSPLPQPWAPTLPHLSGETKSQALYLLSLEACTITHCDYSAGESPGFQWGKEERDTMLDRPQTVLITTWLLRELRQKDPGEEAESVPRHSNTMRNFGLSEIDCGSPGHSLKITVCL